MPSETWTRQLAEVECNRRGWTYVRVGYYDARKRRNQDLLGAFDMLAAADGVTYAIQYTDRSDHSKRRRKLNENAPLAREFALAAGWVVLLWSFDAKGRLKQEKLYD